MRKQGSARVFRSYPLLKVAPSRRGMPAPDPHFPPFPSGFQPARPPPAGQPLPEHQTGPPGGERPVSGKQREPFWCLRSYLGCALRNLKSGAFEEPHHLDLQRLLGRRARAARNQLRPAPRRARHAGPRERLGAQTLRVARATAQPRPLSGGGGARAGRQWRRGLGACCW